MTEPHYDPRATVTLEEADRPDSDKGGYLLTMPASRFLLTGVQLGIILGFAKSLLPEMFVDARLVSENAALRERVEALEAFESVSVALQSLVADLEADRDRLWKALDLVLPYFNGTEHTGAIDDVVRAALAAHEPQEPSS